MSTPEEWQPICDAPRDGSLVYLTWMERGEPQEEWPCRWDAKAENAMFPGVVGFWVVSDGSATWTEHDPDGAPTHWRRAYKH